MKSNTRILKFVAVAALVAGSVPVVSAAGLLGQRYAGATFDWVFPDDNWVDDGRGVTLVLNQPLSQYIDLSASYSYLDTGADIDLGEGEIGSIDASSQNLLFGTTLHAEYNSVKPFVGLSLGWLGTKIDGSTDNDMVYQITPGVEIPAGDKASLTLFASWNDYFDNEDEDDGSWNFGAAADFDLTSTWSLLTKVTIDEDSNWGLSAGALVRF